jgi:hypothetical protein
MFCREAKVSKVSKRRLWWTDETEAHGTARVKVRSRKGCAGYQSEVAAPVRHMAAPHWSVKSSVVME